MTAIVTASAAPGRLPTESGYTAGFLTVGIIGAGAAVVSLAAVLLQRRGSLPEPAPTGALETTAVTPFGQEEVVEAA
jgi:hypothetical protein